MDGWILTNCRKSDKSRKFEGGWRIDIPCHITSTRFEFQYHLADPVKNTSQIQHLLLKILKGIMMKAYKQEFDYDTFSKKLMEDLPSDLIDTNMVHW